MSAVPQDLDLDYTLDARYERERGRVFLTGTQALVRLPLMQRQRDAAAGLDTAGFISGYRGSPLGGLDLNLWRARRFLADNRIEFVAGLNEDLAATAVWGSQQVNLWPGAKHDGVFAMWYGKGPGVDRCGDVLKHANAAGTSPHGGVLVLAGDDHACRSSTLPHQSEHEFISAMMPVLNPAGVQDILEMGLLGWAMSRYTGRWVGFKTIAETVESSASVDIDPSAVQIVTPEDLELPPGGLSIRWPDTPLEQEMRLHQYGLQAARAFARANRLDRIMLDSPRARLGIATTGKSYLDVLQALETLGISMQQAQDIGIRIYKIGMSWPLEPEGVRRFAQGLEDILVVEEKRSFIEKQIKEQLYNFDVAERPSIVGKYDEHGEWILPSTNELTPARIARVIAGRLARFHHSEDIAARLRFLEEKEAELARPRVDFARTPHFCSGCPHNTSTQVPEGSRAMAGIGCHYMTVWMDRRTETFTQMGGEGVPWIGQAPFTETEHIFVNLGDGTYFHSGSLAIRACVAAKANMTFKILYNDAVAMTGGQPVDGTLTVPDIAHQVRAEGVERIVVMSDDIEKWTSQQERFPSGVSFLDRDELEATQRELREFRGVSVLIYDQTCAAEKRRRRKRGQMPDPARRVFINEGVCEGCGDCSVKSNCLAVIPKQTAFGRKREIDQNACNKDFSCLKGFCPSFVTVEGGSLRKPEKASAPIDADALPMPAMPPLTEPYDILITGVGGTGVVTIGALLGMAAHLEGKGVSVLDQTGLAQKFGAVTSHVRLAQQPQDIHAVRIAAGAADLVLGCDMVVAGEQNSLAKMRRERTRAIVNTNESMPGTFTRAPDLSFPRGRIESAIEDAVGAAGLDLVDATRLATRLMGDSIASNLFMLGYAWQKGLVPISHAALTRAIELNGVAVEANLQAFAWGRKMAVDPDAVQAAAGEAPAEPAFETLADLVEHRSAHLRAYQNEAYAARYRDFVQEVATAVQGVRRGDEFVRAVAWNLHRLMAYKDEYEVARLYTSGEFEAQIRRTFDGDFKLNFHLAPPLIAKRDPATGHLRKSVFGPWVMPAFRLLAGLRGLRGSWVDIFGRTEERRMERALIGEYEEVVRWLLPRLREASIAQAIEMARVPESMRGFGHIKEANVAAGRARWRALREALELQQDVADAA